MTKMYCDFCDKQSEKMIHVKLPEQGNFQAYGGRGTAPLIRFVGDVTAVDRDLCESCAKKLIMAIGLIRCVQIGEDN